MKNLTNPVSMADSKALKVWPVRPKIDSLQVLRGVAALIVVVHHGLGTVRLPRNYDTTFLGNFFRTGQFGVDIFFVLSGFIIYYTNPRDRVGGQDYLKYGLRRVTRIYPIYWFVCLGYFPLFYLIQGVGDTVDRSFSHGVASLLLIPTADHPVLGVAWSLQFEMMFYVLFVPFLFRRAAGWALWGVLGAVAVSLFVTRQAPASPWLAQLFSIRILEFLFGCLVCVVARRKAARRGGMFIVIGSLGIFATALWEMRVGKWAIPAHVLHYAFWTAIMIYGLASNALTGRQWTMPRWLVLIGTYSYSIYLVHRPVQQALTQIMVKLTGPAPGLPVVIGVTLFVLGVSLALGMVIGRLVEETSINYTRRWIARLFPRPGSAVPASRAA